MTSWWIHMSVSVCWTWIRVWISFFFYQSSIQKVIKNGKLLSVFVVQKQLLIYCLSFSRSFSFSPVPISAIDIEANGSTSGDSSCNNVPDASKALHASDPIQNAMGQFGKWHYLVCGVIFLLKFPVAWHQMSIIFIAPNIGFRCADPDIADKCSANCTEYEFDRSTFTETLQTTWNLVCQRAQLANLSQTIFMFGILVGNIVFGTLADKWVVGILQLYRWKSSN